MKSLFAFPDWYPSPLALLWCEESKFAYESHVQHLAFQIHRLRLHIPTLLGVRRIREYLYETRVRRNP